MRKIVLTGNIGAGKSTIAKIFQKYHIPLFDADEAIRDIYQNRSDFKEKLQIINSKFIVDNMISKSKIIAYLDKEPDFIIQLENIIYPILAEKRQEFIEINRKKNINKLIFEVPLLFEKNMSSDYHDIILAYAPYDVRLRRALKRKEMTKEKFDFMNNRQIPYEKLLDKVSLAVDTTKSFEECENLIVNRFIEFFE